MCDALASNEHVGVTPQRHRLQRFHSDLITNNIITISSYFTLSCDS